MSTLPVPSGGLFPAPSRGAMRQAQKVAVTVYNAELDAWEMGEITKIWVDTTVDSALFAAKQEMDAADEMMARADGNPVNQEIAAQYTALINNTNRRRIERTFRL